MGVRMYKKFLSALVDTASKNEDQDHSDTDHTCPVEAQSSNGEKHRGNSWLQKTPIQLVMGRRPRDFMDPASKNPEQLTSTPTKQDVLNEEIQKLASPHLEVQQREDMRRDLAK